MVTIENDFLSVSIKEKGAELDNIFSKKTSLEYLWNADPAYWNKKSPILFPIVGTLKRNSYHYMGKQYSLSRHGFAREMEFTCTSQSAQSATFSLESSAQTLTVYPFPFRLDIIYTLQEDVLQVKYRVLNTADENMYFSIGGHPAFKLPLENRLEYDDYYFEFEKIENAMRWTISRDGLIEPMPVPYLINENKLPISKEMFQKDAIVFKHLNSDIISIKSHKSVHGIEFHFPRFPYLGLWAFPGADFVCIEPWCGIADGTQSTQDFTRKEGINLLTGGQMFERAWSVRPY